MILLILILNNILIYILKKSVWGFPLPEFPVTDRIPVFTEYNETGFIFQHMSGVIFKELYRIYL